MKHIVRVQTIPRPDTDGTQESTRVDCVCGWSLYTSSADYAHKRAEEHAGAPAAV